MPKLDNIDSEIGKRIVALRQMKEITRAEIAKALGISTEQVRNYEKGKHRVSAGRLAEMSHFLQVPIAAFFPQEDYRYFRFEEMPRKLSSAFLRIQHVPLQHMAVRMVEIIAATSQRFTADAREEGAA